MFETPIRIVTATGLALALLALSSAWAQTSTRGHDLVDPAEEAMSLLPPPPPTAASSAVLQPDPASAVVFPALVLDTLENGGKMLRGVAISQTAEVEELIFFKVDPETETYSTYLPQELGDRGFRELDRIRRESSRYREAVQCTCPVDPCEGVWTALLTTYDPIFLPLTQTTGHADWHWTSACKLSTSTDEDCWAANPSALGTHWYEDSCWGQNYGIFDTVDYRVQGLYHNYDFGSNSERTDVSQQVRIELKHSIGVIASFVHADWGEGAFLLHGSFYQSGQNTCFF